MSSTITAGNATNGLALSCDNTGILELKTGTGSGTTAITADASQNVTVAGTLTAAKGVGGTPAFSAYASATTSLSNVTWTKVAFATESFDTNNNFSSSTFTPTVAGYYQINANVGFPVTTGLRIAIYKNGSAYCYVSADGTSAVLDGYGHIAGLVHCNGSTDYIEIYAFSNGNGTTSVSSGATNTLFSGFLARAA